MKINWVGSKVKLLPRIINHLPPTFKTYYEPFLGSGAVYWHLKPKKAVLNDNDDHLITMWRQSLNYPKHFVEKVEALHRYLHQTNDHQQQKQIYKQLLTQYNTNPKQNLTTKTAIFYVLTKYAFRGITGYKVNNHFKVNFGFDNYLPQSSIIDLQKLMTMQRHFKKYKHVLTCLDFMPVINNSKEDDFIFVDPPYYYEGVKAKTFYQKPFTFSDHQRLATTLNQATKRGVKWLYTNYANADIMALFPHCKIIQGKTTTSHAFNHQHNKKEMIITNY